MGGAHFLKLMQLGDSALPSGGYAFSNGLESAHKSGVVPDAEVFETCLIDQLFQLRMGELPFIHSCYTPATLDEDSFVDLAAYYDAMQLVPAIRRASVVLGRNWLRLMGQFSDSQDVGIYGEWLTQAGLSAHLTPLFGATMRATGLSEEEAKLLFCHQFVRDQVSSAVRLSIVGPMEATRIHRNVLPACDDLMQDTIPYQEASRWLPRWDIAQCQHDQLYTRLFQN
jgi:urease accessory protein